MVKDCSMGLRGKKRHTPFITGKGGNKGLQMDERKSKKEMEGGSSGSKKMEMQEDKLNMPISRDRMESEEGDRRVEGVVDAIVGGANLDFGRISSPLGIFHASSTNCIFGFVSCDSIGCESVPSRPSVFESISFFFHCNPLDNIVTTVTLLCSSSTSFRIPMFPSSSSILYSLRPREPNNYPSQPGTLGALLEKHDVPKHKGIKTNISKARLKEKIDISDCKHKFLDEALRAAHAPTMDSQFY